MTRQQRSTGISVFWTWQDRRGDCYCLQRHLRCSACESAAGLGFGLRLTFGIGKKLLITDLLHPKIAIKKVAVCADSTRARCLFDLLFFCATHTSAAPSADNASLFILERVRPALKRPMHAPTPAAVTNTVTTTHTLSDFDFELPEALIAQPPALTESSAICPACCAPVT
jgi:hypothetical protein